MLLSIIVPFYGVEAYIGECLRGLQGLGDDAEILLVDDCGQDGSRAIAEEFCQNNSNARILTRERNGGLSAARNTGLDAARGEFVCFVDSDDIPDGPQLLSAARHCKASGLDMARGSFQYLYESGVKRESRHVLDGQTVPGKALFLEASRQGAYEPMVWQGVFRRDFLISGALRMREGMLFEDELFMTPALFIAQKVYCSPACFLLYRQRGNSIMGAMQKSSRWCRCYLEICRELSQFADRQNRDEAQEMLRRRIARIALSLGKNIEAYGLSGRVRQEAKDFLRQNKKEICHYTKNCTSSSLRLQGLMLQFSPALFLRLYGCISRGQSAWGEG